MLVKRAPKGIMKPLALHLENTITVQQLRKLTMRQMHDGFIGMLEGEDAQPLYDLERRKICIN